MALSRCFGLKEALSSAILSRSVLPSTTWVTRWNGDKCETCSVSALSMMASEPRRVKALRFGGESASAWSTSVAFSFGAGAAFAGAVVEDALRFGICVHWTAR